MFFKHLIITQQIIRFASNFTPNSKDVNRNVWETPEWHNDLEYWPSWNPSYLGRTGFAIRTKRVNGKETKLLIMVLFQ